MIKGAPQPELGKKFIDYMLSLEGQNHLHKFFRVPLHPKAVIANAPLRRDCGQSAAYRPAVALALAISPFLIFTGISNSA